MKQLSTTIFSLTLSFILCAATLAPRSASAQTGLNRLDTETVPAVAFVKTALNGQSRSVLYIKRPNQPVDVYDIATIVNQIATAQIIDSIRHLAVIGMTPHGDQLVLGGQVFFLNPSNGTHTSFAGIFRIPWPLTTTRMLQDPPFDNQNNPRWFLQAAPDLGSFHPSGILSPDGSRWYASMRTSSPGTDSMRFYSGLVNGSAPVDSALITADVAGGISAPQGAWIESNIALDTTNGTMLLVEVDALESSGNQAQRYLIIHWHPGDANIYTRDISNDIKGLSGNIQIGLDSCFAAVVAAVQDGHNIEVGLQYLGGKSDTDHTIEFYKIGYNPDGTELTPAVTIPRTVLPDKSYTFFAGENTWQYQGTVPIFPVYADDNSVFHEHAQSGDIMLTNNGQTALFITHEYPQNLDATTPLSPRNVKSAIFTYDFSGNPATMIYDDSNAQELQPVFVTAKDTIPHTAGLVSNNNTIDFGTVDTAKTSSQMVTVSDTSAYAGAYIDSAKITGDAEFTITSPSFPQTVPYSGSAQLNLQFAPVGATGARNATLTIYSSLSANPKLTVNLTGTAKVQQGGNGGVAEDPALGQNVFVSPNPFSSITTVRLIAPDAASLGIVVHDAMGRVVYTSPVLHAGAGESQSFEVNAKSLGLANGVYYVTALFGERQVTKQIVLTR